MADSVAPMAPNFVALSTIGELELQSWLGATGALLAFVPRLRRFAQSHRSDEERANPLQDLCVPLPFAIVLNGLPDDPVAATEDITLLPDWLRSVPVILDPERSITRAFSMALDHPRQDSTECWVCWVRADGRIDHHSVLDVPIVDALVRFALTIDSRPAGTGALPDRS
ncbi:MAG: hypothetical protein KF911_02515 [Pseudomonadales bacterium]|nr:hypothetical protein [Pseudomonadales bacterium]